jgi:TonB family protein
LIGRFTYQGVVEEAGVTIKSDGNVFQLLLTGRSYRRISGTGSFALDTFSGPLSGDGLSILGSYVDTSGHRGQWKVVKVTTIVEKHAETATPETSPATGGTRVTIEGNRDWTDTGINLLLNDTVNISAAGSVKVTTAGHVPDIPSMSPSGYPPDCAAANRVYGPFSQRAIRGFPAFDLPCWSLIGRVGTQGRVFAVASNKTLTVTAPGELYLGVNDENVSDNSGSWTASITVLRQSDFSTEKVSYQNRICEGADDGQPNEILTDHSSEEIDEFTITLRPGCFSGYILIPESWKSYTMEAAGATENWWMAYKWYPKNSGSGERPPLTAHDLSTIGRHTSQKIRVQGYGRLLIRRPTSATSQEDANGIAGAPFRVGGLVSAPVVVHKVEPEYTEEARTAKLQGTVLLTTIITAEGRAADVRVVRPLGKGLDEKAIEAVKKWQFRPGTKGAVPVPVMAKIEVNFRLH